MHNPLNTSLITPELACCCAQSCLRTYSICYAAEKIKQHPIARHGVACAYTITGKQAARSTLARAGLSRSSFLSTPLLQEYIGFEWQRSITGTTSVGGVQDEFCRDYQLEARHCRLGHKGHIVNDNVATRNVRAKAVVMMHLSRDNCRPNKPSVHAGPQKAIKRPQPGCPDGCHIHTHHRILHVAQLVPSKAHLPRTAGHLMADRVYQGPCHVHQASTPVGQGGV